MKVGLFFGSFNPVHIGHLVIANFMAENTDLQKVWFVVSPHNPLKEKKSLLKDAYRLHLVRLATEDNTKFKVSDIEFKLPQPSYTIHTLTYLKEKFPQHEFVLIMGSDNLESLEKWKNYEIILRDYEIYVYSRAEKLKTPLENHAHVKIFEVPVMDISSSEIRKLISEKKSARYLLPEIVYEEIKTRKFYRKTVTV
ncbi:MAG: nicotinate-nucleotide adenylyltransferase [Sphingobacteriales bacterium]|nr:MAG: nicotinate-nucleotide adenylyltransferase [Sphingobacteriales bacterium]